ncbi:four-carbon acid sugar kinase family protein [Neobacillus cucumis]|uniref:four-carbon acid sugar kinase family protein n=1 Tax=Neobacillus cucumis TaxID=1740721 RepID=UPI002E1B0B7E|nr:four-carbon acid sugar kinase family protein [Neobacillus cucumis]
MIGVVADDTTGANDIGIMFTNSGYKVKVVTFEPDLKVIKDTDVLIIDTDSRLDSPTLGYEKVKKATEILKNADCTMYFNKTCSVFRGNIGGEFDAMLDELAEEFAIISLAFPKNGRTTCQGIHKVYGKLLEESEFANDPVHPMHESKLQSILQKQTKRKVISIYLDVVRKGPAALRDSIEAARNHYNYVIIDAETQEDLLTIAEASVGYKILAGSSAIGEELPKVLKKSEYQNLANTIEIKDKNGIIVISGSLTPQTKGQTQELIESGFPFISVDSRIIISETESDEELKRVVNNAKAVLTEGKDMLIMADNNPEILKETKEIGLAQGFNELEISKKISDFLAEVAKKLTDDLNLKRIVVAGGDTSGTVCRKLNIKGNYIISEIDTGVPSGLAIGQEMLIVLKSGSFGKRDFLIKAVEHLKQLSK